jgi:hypothetical protein
MAKEKVTLTLDADRMAELRKIVGTGSLSSAVDGAVAVHLTRLRHLAALDDWLSELEREHGPVPVETLEWAAQVIDRWDAERGRSSNRRRAS